MRPEDSEGFVYEIRLRYSTIINYVFTMYRLFTSLAFMVIVARRFSVEEFAIWGIILSFLLMLSSFTVFWNFWAKRFYVRGIKGSLGTSLILNLAYLMPASLAYIIMAHFTGLALGWGSDRILLGLPILPFYILAKFVDSSFGVIKPEVVGYRSFIYETSRLALVIFLILGMNMKLEGAILAMGTGLAISLVYGFLELIRLRALSLKFVPKLVEEWSKGSYIPLMNSVTNFLMGSLRAVTSWFTGNELPVAYLNVGIGVQAPITRASWSSSLALYPRMMKYRKGEDISETLRIYVAIAGFMLVSLIALSKGIVSLYNPKYIDAYPILIIVAFYSLLLGFNRIYLTVLRGVAEEDKEGILDYRKVLRSYLFKAPFIQLVTIMLGYGIGISLLFMYHGDHLMEAAGMLVGLLVGSAALLFIIGREAKKVVPYKFPWKEVQITIVASLTSFVYYVASGSNEILIGRFWRDVPFLGLHLLVALTLYLIVLYALSPWFRDLLSRALKELHLKVR